MLAAESMLFSVSPDVQKYTFIFIFNFLAKIEKLNKFNVLGHKKS